MFTGPGFSLSFYRSHDRPHVVKKESHMADKFRIVALRYMSIYVKSVDDAVAFYSQVFGEPEYVDADTGTRGWKIGDTWFTVLSSKGGSATESNPVNTEFAIQVGSSDEVDRLYDALIEAGATRCCAPEDTWMYEKMRFSAVDDPFGVRIDVYCPLPE